MAVPATVVNCPSGHLVWAVQESVLRLLLDTAALNNPAAHVSHIGCKVMDPTALVYVPLGHLVWSVQESVSRLLLDTAALNDPGLHAVH